jgi:hypothetical protein
MKARAFLADEIKRIQNLIEENRDKESNIKLKQELSQIIYLLDILNIHTINKNTIETVVELPPSDTGYSEYRVINDCESDHSENWIELSLNNQPLRLAEGDIIIKKK